MSWILYCPSDHSKIERVYGQNAGIDAALQRLKEMLRQRSDVTFTDTAELSDSERAETYLSKAVVSATYP